VTFHDWQALAPREAARELRRRAEDRLGAGQLRSSLAVLLDEDALTEAFACAAPGPLRGVPYMLKDLYDVRGLPTRAGSSFLSEVRGEPSADSAFVGELRGLGAVLAGKTHLFEFAWGLTGENAHYGNCEHPRAPGRTSGGSSSGSACAVAAGIVPLSIGTDTGGSVRVPAAYCGLFGYRGAPGDARISDALALAPSFDTAGWFTATAGDMRAVVDALVGSEVQGAEPRGVYLEMPGLDAEVSEACRRAASAFAPEAGRVLGDELREKFAPAGEVYGVLAGTESWRIHRRWAEKLRGRYGPLLQERLDQARAISPAQIAAVLPSRDALCSAWSRYFAEHEFLVMASAPTPALLASECTQANRLRTLSLAAPASLGGLAVLSIPVPLDSGLTAGLQFVLGRPGSPALAWVLDSISRRTG
jgi:amidase/aspartyl-tRNA(Asn)/glutamyl-tRNA(Gln) amidotransferase subunit A